MKQLMLKDLYTQRLFGYAFPLFFLLPFYMSSLTGVNYLVIYVTYASIWLTVYSNFGTAESNRMGLKLISSLPITRKNVVQAKYGAAFMWWGIGFVLYGTMAFLINLLLGNTFNIGFISSMILSLCVTFIIISFFYPLYFLLGYQIAAGITMIFPMLGFFVMMTITIDDISGEPLPWELFPTDYLSNILFVLASVIITRLSYLLSVKIFEKKDL
ncbi:ABC-2 transporter permease [Lederbergia citrea]|uniref:ABC-2 transporter permease n=1 Tax=Lederbergia citrea TaxID=2833581 RepID=UPI001BC8DF04|nr:ABC-2 transporter permease [Lederbergia citrea]MBS4179267.1 ABC-2 transporter permease [Lederbergia citrea]